MSMFECFYTKNVNFKNKQFEEKLINRLITGSREPNLSREPTQHKLTEKQ